MAQRSTIFLSDVHLRPEAPGVTRLFLRFLDFWKLRARTIWILGDLFDIWMGPRHAVLPEYQAVLEKLAGVSAAGVEVALLLGNRDFHLDQALGKQIGADILGESVVISLEGKRVLLTHGDRLCANDKWNFVYRTMVRSSLVVSIYRALPLSFGRFLANAARVHSKRAVRRKPRKTVALAPPAITKRFESGVDAIICGHAHREAHVRWPTPAGLKDLYVLGAWNECAPYAEFRDGKLSLGRFW